MPGLRIVAGDLGGLRLVAPDSARPTTDRVREAVFSALGDRAVDVNVLDLFAGSGAMAIEALSRGASRGVLVDRERSAMAAIRKNLVSTKLLTRARAVRKPVRGFLLANPPREAPFGLVCCDPPYDLSTVQLADTLGLLARPGWVAADATVVVERAAGGAPDLPSPWVSTWERTYGDTLVVIASAP